MFLVCDHNEGYFTISFSLKFWLNGHGWHSFCKDSCTCFILLLLLLLSKSTGNALTHDF